MRTSVVAPPARQGTAVGDKFGKKLFASQVRIIKETLRFNFDGFTEVELAAFWDVHPTMINHIKHGRCWKDVELP